MTKPKHATEDFDAFDCSSAPLLSQCSRRVTMKRDEPRSRVLDSVFHVSA